MASELNRLHNRSGYFCTPTETIRHRTPLWSVNAPTAIHWWRTKGKAMPFLYSNILFNLSKCPPMKESNLSLMAYNLLNAATALAGIIDQPVKGNLITVNFRFAAELIRDMQVTAKTAADELMFIQDEKGGEK